jgi:hypothetical protein
MTPAPNRRSSFSLRTMFVAVTLLACWIGWGLWTFRSATSERPFLVFVVVSILLGGNLAITFLTWVVVRLRR